jgi:signal peptidase I
MNSVTTEPNRAESPQNPAGAIAPAGLAAPSATAGAAPPAERPRRRIARRVARGLLEWAKSVSLALLLFFVLRAFLVEAFKIPSGSMEGTLLAGDFLLVNKLVYGAEVPFTGKRLPAIREPRNGDILVFLWPPDPTKNLVKRVVGSPGDTVEMQRGVLFRNGQRLEEDYTRHIEPNYDPVADDFAWQRPFLIASARTGKPYHPSRNTWGPIEVPPRHYFVLGDNRDNSLDSRYWGFVPDSLVRGSPLVVYYSYIPDTASSFSWLTRVRWKRLFSRVH